MGRVTYGGVFRLGSARQAYCAAYMYVFYL